MKILPRGRLVLISLAVLVGMGAAPWAYLAVSRKTSTPEDEASQRAAVERFEELVLDGAWEELYPLVSDPPGGTLDRFASSMRKKEAEEGKVVNISTHAMKLHQSEETSILEVTQTVTSEKKGVQRESQVASFFVWDGEQWLFAFSAPSEPL